MTVVKEAGQFLPFDFLDVPGHVAPNIHSRAPQQVRETFLSVRHEVERRIGAYAGRSPPNRSDETRAAGPFLFSDGEMPFSSDNRSRFAVGSKMETMAAYAVSIFIAGFGISILIAALGSGAPIFWACAGMVPLAAGLLSAFGPT
jgi:hypothetical protein